MRLVLIGFMGSGKSTVAKLLAQRLKYPLIQLDELIVQRSGETSVNAIFEKHGEAHFRRLESEACAEAAKATRTIIDPGGGVINNPENIRQLRSGAARIIWLRTSFETAQARVGTMPNRPLFRDPAAARALFDERVARYQAAADAEVDTDQLTPEQIVEEIVRQEQIT